MTEITDQVGTAIGGFAGSPGVQLAIRLALLYLVALWVSAAWWIYRDVERRVPNELARYLAPAIVILATPLFFPLVVAAYRIVRPAETLAEAAEQELTELALAGAPGVKACPSCGAAVGGDWRLCPWCSQELLQPCRRCGHPVEAGWSVCPWCVADLPPWTPVRRHRPSPIRPAQPGLVAGIPWSRARAAATRVSSPGTARPGRAQPPRPDAGSSPRGARA